MHKVVAVLNHDADIIEMISTLLLEEGFVVVSGHLPPLNSQRYEMVTSLLQQHKPLVVMYDIAPPYRENYEFFLTLRRKDNLTDIQFVLTTTNKKMLEKEVKNKVNAIEIIGKPYDIREIVEVMSRKAYSR